MKISKQARREAKDLFRSCLANGKLDEHRVRQVVQHVVAAKPRGYLAILSHFQRLVQLDEHRRTAKVESATALNPEAQANVTQSLARTYGPDLKITFAQNPELIGGLRIQVGSDVYDGSILARLHVLQESF